MYLTLDEPELANQCLLKSQTLDPDYARAWLGQGLLADKSGDKDQARSLFGHSVTLAAGSLVSWIFDHADISSRQISPLRRPCLSDI